MRAWLNRTPLRSLCTFAIDCHKELLDQECVHAGEYGLEVIEMDAESFRLPANRLASYVTLWNPSTGAPWTTQKLPTAFGLSNCVT